MGASREFGLETITCLSGRLRIALSAVAVLFLGCGVTSDSSPVAPSAVRAEVFTDPPLPGHAFVAMGAFGSMAVVTGEPAMAFAQSACGFQFVFVQRIGVLPSPPPDRGEVGFRPPLVLTTAVIPPGVFPITLVTYCSPYYIFDVDFSHP